MLRAWVEREKLPDSANEKLNVKIDSLLNSWGADKYMKQLATDTLFFCI